MAHMPPKPATTRTDHARDAHHDAEIDVQDAKKALQKLEAVAELARRALLIACATDALEEIASISTTEHFQCVIASLEQALAEARLAAKGQPA